MKPISKHRKLLATLISLVIIGFTCQNCFGEIGEIVLPRLNVIGSSFVTVTNVLEIVPAAKMPKTVTFDLKDGRVVGLVCDYDTGEADFQVIKLQLSRWLKAKPKFEGNKTATWRLDDTKSALMLTWDTEKEVMRIILISKVRSQ